MQTIFLKSVLKIILITFFLYKFKFSIEFSLLASIFILVCLDLIYLTNETFISLTDTSDIIKTSTDNSSTDNKLSNNNLTSNNLSSSNSTNNLSSNSNTNNTVSSKLNNNLSSSSNTSINKVNNTNISNNALETNNLNNTNDINVDTTNDIKNILNSNINDVTSQNINKPPLSPNALSVNGLSNMDNVQKGSQTAINSIFGLENDKDDQNETKNIKDSILKENNKDKPKLECRPVIPHLLFTENTNKNYIARISINSAIINNGGKCIINDHPFENNLSLGKYKTMKPKLNDTFQEIPVNLLKINNEAKHEKKEINIFIKKGYKITFISNKKIKSFIGVAKYKDTPFVNSNEIKKGLLNISEILVEKL